MTTADERTRAILNARAFLQDLLNPKTTPKVPKKIRDRASRLLKHYPSALHIVMAIRGDKDVLDQAEAAKHADEVLQAFAKLRGKT